MLKLLTPQQHHLQQWRCVAQEKFFLVRVHSSSSQIRSSHRGPSQAHGAAHQVSWHCRLLSSMCLFWDVSIAKNRCICGCEDFKRTCKIVSSYVIGGTSNCLFERWTLWRTNTFCVKNQHMGYRGLGFRVFDENVRNSVKLCDWLHFAIACLRCTLWWTTTFVHEWMSRECVKQCQIVWLVASPLICSEVMGICSELQCNANNGAG